MVEKTILFLSDWHIKCKNHCLFHVFILGSGKIAIIMMYWIPATWFRKSSEKLAILDGGKYCSQGAYTLNAKLKSEFLLFLAVQGFKKRYGK